MTSVRYHVTLRILHWFMAITILSLFAVGLYMTGMEEEDPLRGTLYGLHKSFGALILFLVALRLTVKVFTTTPRLPQAFAKWEKGLAHAGHALLYLLMFGVPLAGVWMSNSWGYGVSMFGLELPRLFEENREIAPLAGEIHELLAFAIIGVVCLHVAGVLKHRFIDRNDILYRMGFGRVPTQAGVAAESNEKDA
jgi:cytochrome b561